MLAKWSWTQKNVTALDLWARLSKFGSESREAFVRLAAGEDTLGRILGELAKATIEGPIAGVTVVKPPRSHSRKWEVIVNRPEKQTAAVGALSDPTEGIE
jgi:hypothetical protein